MSNRYLVRPESFGATLYDPASTGYVFLSHRQHARLALAQGWPVPTDVDPAVDADPDTDRVDELIRDCAGRSFQLHPAPGPLPSDSLAAPVRVYFELTTRCNGQCRYCLNGSGQRVRDPELTGEEALRVIAGLGRDGVLEVRLTGGEATLRPDFFPLAEAVRGHQMALTLNSNLLVSRATLERLIALRPDLLITSLDASPRAHATGRGPGFGRIQTHVRALREAGIPVRLNCLLGPNSIPDIARFIDRMAAIGCGFCFILERPVGRAGADFAPPPLDDLIGAARLIESKRCVWPGVYFNTSFHVVMEQDLILGGIDLTGCNAIQKSFNINSNGEVLPCAFLYELAPAEFSLGNVRDHDYSVLPIWRESPLLRRLRVESAECNRRCIRCDHFKSDCLGSCLLMDIYARRGGRPDPYCRRSLDQCRGHATGGGACR